MKKSKPLVTIYMPVFNAQDFLVESIESILNQTYSNFEFIIVDDASTDNSWKIIKTYAKKDKRIVALKNHINLGVSLTSNIALSKAKGQFVARMDADDISFTDRIEKQLAFLQKNPKTIVVGGQCIVINQNNQIIGNKNFPTDPKILKEMIFWAIPLQQPSMMVNTQKLPKNFQWYSANFSSAEEVDLIFKFITYGEITNLNDNLLYYRHLNTSLSHINPKNTFKLTIKSRINAIKLGHQPSIKAILLNVIQIIVVSVLPSSLINDIWYLIRGIKKVETRYQVGEVIGSEV